MFERYTDRARRVIFFARYEASALAGSCIDTEHLLLGLLREGSGVTGDILRRHGVKYEAARREIAGLAPATAPMEATVDIPLAIEAQRVLQRAFEESERMEAPHIGSEHLLLGLLGEADCLAARILRGRDLRLEDLREEVRLRTHGSERAPGRAAFDKLVDFLGMLEEKRAGYHVSPYGGDAVRIEVALPEERWSATFFAGGRVAVEVYATSGRVEDETALARLLDRLRKPPSG